MRLIRSLRNILSALIFLLGAVLIGLGGFIWWLAVEVQAPPPKSGGNDMDEIRNLH